VLILEIENNKDFFTKNKNEESLVSLPIIEMPSFWFV
jgi:hypothetical protein